MRNLKISSHRTTLLTTNNKFKVVHIITRLEFGGAQQNTLYTVSHLDASRFDVVLLAGEGEMLDSQARLLAQSSERPFQLRFFPQLVRKIDPVRDLSAFFQLWRFLYQEKPQIVHTHSSKAGILGRCAAWAARVPVIIHTYHGFGFHDRQSRFVRIFFVLLEKLCCRFSTQIIFVSEDNRRYAQQSGLLRPGQGVVIRSGIRLSDYPALLPDKAQKKASLGCRMHKPMVVSVGNLKPQKNPEGFLRVAELSLKEVQEVSFVFIGDGELKPRLESRVLSCGLQGKIFFLGWRRDTPEILAAADVFILTSLWEGLPRSLVEAMKSGLPCVCYATDGVQDLIQDGKNGYLIPIDNEKLMADRIVELLKNDKKAKEIGEVAAKSIGDDFDINRMVKEQERLYVNLSAKKGIPLPPQII